MRATRIKLGVPMTVNHGPPAAQEPEQGRPTGAPPVSAPLRRTQAERSAATRQALLEAGRALFADHGFARAGQEDIVERAGVTRGALSHHFGTKEGLFLAVVQDVQADLAGRIARAAM